MSETITLEVRGTPHGRPRPVPLGFKTKTGKVAARMVHLKGNRRGSRSEKAWAKAHAWSSAVKLACFQKMPASPWTGPIELTIDAYFERPQRLNRRRDPDGPIRHTAKPDRDNVDKAVLDALKEAGLFTDDCQVCDGPVRKWYAAKGAGPGVIIVARRLLAEEGALC